MQKGRVHELHKSTELFTSLPRGRESLAAQLSCWKGSLVLPDPMYLSNRKPAQPACAVLESLRICTDLSHARRRSHVCLFITVSQSSIDMLLVRCIVCVSESACDGLQEVSHHSIDSFGRSPLAIGKLQDGYHNTHANPKNNVRAVCNLAHIISFNGFGRGWHQFPELLSCVSNSA